MIISPGFRKCGVVRVRLVSAAGRYSATQGSTTSDCGGPCLPGQYGDGVGSSTTPYCDGNCTAGYYCPAGKRAQRGCMDVVVAARGTCGVCAFVVVAACAGAAPCCRIVENLASVACPGSTSSTFLICPVGTYSLAAAPSCTNCSAGTYGALPGMSSPACTGLCQVCVWKTRVCFSSRFACLDKKWWVRGCRV